MTREETGGGAGPAFAVPSPARAGVAPTRVELGKSRVDVRGVGARAATGLGSVQVAMGMRAGKARNELTALRDGLGRRMRMLLVPGLPDSAMGSERLALLAAPALREACAEAGMLDATKPVALLLAVGDEGRPDIDALVGLSLAIRIAELAGVQIDHELSRVVRGGHAAGAAVFAAGAAHVEETASTVVVGGVDSWKHPEAVRWLAQRGLFGGSIGGNPSYGEAAAFAVLSRTDGAAPRMRLCAAVTDRLPAAARDRLRQARAERARAEAAAATSEGLAATTAWLEERRARRMRAFLARLAAESGARRRRALPWSTGAPAASDERPEPEIGETMGTLVTRAIAAWPSLVFTWVVSDVNGELERVDEWSEVARSLPLDYRHDRPATLLGDVGAASAALFTAVAARLWEAGAVRAPAGLVAVHGEDGLRGLVLLRAPSAPGTAD